MRDETSHRTDSNSAIMASFGTAVLGTNAGRVRNRRRAGGSNDQARTDPKTPRRYRRVSGKPGRPVASAASRRGRSATVVRLKWAIHSAADHPAEGGRA